MERERLGVSQMRADWSSVRQGHSKNVRQYLPNTICILEDVGYAMTGVSPGRRLPVDERALGCQLLLCATDGCATFAIITDRRSMRGGPASRVTTPEHLTSPRLSERLPPLLARCYRTSWAELVRRS